MRLWQDFKTEQNGQIHDDFADVASMWVRNQCIKLQSVFSSGSLNEWLFFSCYDSFSVSESSTKVSGLPHVTDPQLHDGRNAILFHLHLHLLVVQVLQVHCNNSVQTLRTGSNSKALVSIDCCRGQAPIRKFRDPRDSETELLHSAIQLSDNGLNLCGASRHASDVGGRLSASFPLLNNYTLIRSVFVISVNGSYILQTNFSTMLSAVSSPQPNLVSSWLVCFNAFHAVTLPCPAN